MGISELTSLFLLGLVYGASICSFSCLPYFGPYLIGSGSGFRDGVISTSAFGAGKIFTYSISGGIAALFGRTMTVTPGVRLTMGLLLMAAAVSVPFIARGGCVKRTQLVGKRLSMFVLGSISSVLPCPPLAAVLLLASRQQSIPAGAMYGFCYGLGLLISPMLLIGGGLGLVSYKIRYQVRVLVPYMQGSAVVIMFALGWKMIW